MAKKNKKDVKDNVNPKDAKTKGKELKNDSKNSKTDSKNGKDDNIKPTRGLNLNDNFGWTGKLPMTLLYEHCQRNKWNKPIIDIHKPQGKCKAVITLSWENPKTKELIKIPYNNGKLLPTINEAKHYAATFTLFKLSFNKNLKLLLPNIFKDYWDELTTERLNLLKTDKTKHDILYNENPFQVYLQQQELKAQLQKEKEKSRKEKLERKAKLGLSEDIDFKQIKSILNKNGENPQENKDEKSDTLSKSTESTSKAINSPFISKKTWEAAPIFDIDSEIRIALEDKLKYFINWSLISDTSPKVLANEMNSLFVGLGFKVNHVNEALKYTNSINGVLEWLLFYIPEDDLPPFFNRSNYSSLMKIKISKPLHHELIINNLTNSGYPLTEVLSTLSSTGFEESLATLKLTQSIARTSDTISKEDLHSSLTLPPTSPEESQEIWYNELSSLQSMDYSIEFITSKEIESTTAIVDLPTISSKFKFFKPANYPNDIVGIQLMTKLPNYIKLSIISKIINQLVTNQFLGFEYIFNIIDFLVNNWSELVNNPGPLINQSLFKANSPLFKLDTLDQGSENGSKMSLGGFNLRSDSEKIQAYHDARIKEKKFSESLNTRMKLPSWQKRQEILNTINQNQVVLITGETGSGKSTQIVQYILDQAYEKKRFESKIMITQPRRISTLGLADRISSERLTQVGKEVGYIIRGDSKVSSTTSVYFVTIGVLLRFLQTSKKVLNNLHYLIIDEVHERSIDSDFLLILLKLLLSSPNFKHLKIILMSATIDTSIFAKFFKKEIPHIHIPGRTFPINDVYLPEILSDLDYKMELNNGQVISPQADSNFFKSGNINYDMIVKLVYHLINTKVKQLHGSILVFMPGVFEINRLISRILDYDSTLDANITCYPLHSGLNPGDQVKVFKTPPKGSVKIVVATNVAETSITIPDCTIVIDTGRVKLVKYDAATKLTRLVETWCSKSEMLQRRGRSGRIKSGNCYHLYTKETESEWLINPIPEILRTNLDNLYLIIKSMGVSKVKAFLLNGIDSPLEMSLSSCEQNLTTIGALSLNNDNDHELTNLGKYLSYLPTDLSNGKLLIYGCIFGCINNCLLISSIKSIGSGSLFIKNQDLRDKFKLILSKHSNGNGDLIGYLNLIKLYLLISSKSEKNAFIKNNHLSKLVINDVISTRDQFVNLLTDLNFMNTNNNDTLNRNDQNVKLLKALITSAYYPNIAKINYPSTKYTSSTHGAIETNPDDRLIKYFIKNDGFESGSSDNYPVTRVFVHPSSTLFKFNKDGTDETKAYNPDLTPQVSSLNQKPPFSVYSNSFQTSKHYISDITPVNPISVLLFGGEISYNLAPTFGQLSPGIVMDNWIPIKTWCKNAVLLKYVRLLLDQILDIKLSSIASDGENEDVNEILSIVEQLINASN